METQEHCPFLFENTKIYNPCVVVYDSHLPINILIGNILQRTQEGVPEKKLDDSATPFL